MVKRNVHAASTSPAANGKHQNPAMSFVMLTESQVAQARNGQHVEPPQVSQGKSGSGTQAPESAPQESLLSYQMETTARLFEILSARSDIDHPICVECTEMLVEGLQKRLGSATRERDAYIEFLRQANADIPTDEEVQAAEAELRDAQQREAAALTELEQLEKEKAVMDQEILALEEESNKLDEEERDFWEGRNAFSAKLADFQNERDRVNAKYEHDSKQFQRLQRINVFNDLFSVSHDGNFATINNLRLGRLPDKTVEWAEINAALGNCCLLLATIADKLGFQFKGYELKPLGSTSTICRLDAPPSSSNDPAHQAKIKRSEYPLYNSGDLALGLVAFHTNFNNALVCFLECVRQLGEYVAQTTFQGQDGSVKNGPELPYKIHKDRINDLSIKFASSKDEDFTKACKYLLTCLKFLLAHCSNISSISRRAN